MGGDLASTLQQLQANTAVSLVAVVGLDGLVIEGAAGPGVDMEALAAVAAPGLVMMGDLADELGEGPAEITTLEFHSHVAAMAPVNENALLLMITDPGSMNLGQMRIVLRRTLNTVRDLYVEE
jgi:predicted regulator of Ras-like GTPase activity (Roadblock/LC7/MglB family)